MRGGLHARVVVRRPRFVLDAEIEAPAGSTTALLGPNGAGKTTMVAAVAGVIPLDAGHITLGDVTLDDPDRAVFVPPEARGIGVVFQGYLLFPHLSVLENVAFGPRSSGADRETSRRRAAVWLEQLGLTDLAAVGADRLSGGQAQRVALARSLAAEPRLLLLDEPLAALDVSTRTQLRRTLSRHLDAYPGPRVLITHDPTEAFLLADRIYILEEGRITQVGTADEIRLRPRTPYAADLAGANLFSGTAGGGIVDVGSHTLQVADEGMTGSVLVTIHPRAIALHPRRPDGSPRNTWPTEVTLVEHLGDRVRVQFERPLHLTAEVTENATVAMHLEKGSMVWVAIKATEIGVTPDAPQTRGPGPDRGHELPE